MDFLTYAQIKTNIQAQTDTEAEDFIQPAELMGYVNEAIDIAQADIHKLGMEDEYFLSRTYIPITVGVEEYELPTDIYSNKIRDVVYELGTTIFPIKRARKRRFEIYSEFTQFPPATNYYLYMLINPYAGQKPKMLLMPASRETSATRVRMWYIRNANKMVDDASVCDIPQFHMFIEKYCKWKIYMKEGNPIAVDAAIELEAERKQMIETLENMVEDDNSQIPADYTTYTDLS